MIEMRNLRVGEIAGELGWDSTVSFIKAFKRFNGVTPGKFKKLCGKIVP